jgi:RNA recognition motif-containing protein
MNIYVGNLPRASTQDELKQLFEGFGEVKSASIVKDRDTGESRGFGFVEMADNQAAQTAINSLNDKDFQGRKLTVNEARPKTENRGGGRSGGFRPRNKS